MNSLVQRNSANLYKQLADPYGQNPLGEFGTDIQGLELQAQTELGPGIARPSPTTGSTTETGTTGTGTTGTDTTGTGTTGTDTTGTGTTTTAETVKEPTYKYNSVDVPFCQGFINTPWYNWTFNNEQQTALNFLQAQGDELIISYYSQENKYPELATKMLLPNNNPKFTMYNYSDRQMAYLYHNRNPTKFRFMCPKYDEYVAKWCTAFDKFGETCRVKGVSFNEQEIYQLTRNDTMSFPSYIDFFNRNAQTRFGFDSLTPPSVDSMTFNTGGYLKWENVKLLKTNKSAAIAKAKEYETKNVYYAGTVDTFQVVTGERPVPSTTSNNLPKQSWYNFFEGSARFIPSLPDYKQDPTIASTPLF
jgi:hypothetical protein